jgi:ATP-dependent helicase HrpB
MILNSSGDIQAYPIAEVIPQILLALKAEPNLVITAPPGAGKSTVLPLALLDLPILKGKKIIMLEPRRLAAKSIAMRMSELIHEPVGQTIGYRVRFEQKVSNHTRLEVVTEGILTKMLLNDTGIESVGMVIFDEFHERSIHADTALAFCIETQKLLRPDLKLLIMSATLNLLDLTHKLNAKSITCMGKSYPVDIVYTGQSDITLLPELCVKTVIDAAQKHTGDILVFLPGEAEIKKCAEALALKLPQFKIYPLYGRLPFFAQQQAILPDKNNKRKVVLATSIAQTSLTIEGIEVVIDSGYIKMQRFDARSGLTRLETVQIAQDAADQRAGRAGRLKPGTCYRMWSAATQQKLPVNSTPEILEADLASLMLDMYSWGITNIYNLFWLNPPPKGHVAQAIDTLTEINAIDENGITNHGKAIQKLPCHPRIAHMLLMANTLALQQLATDLAAVLEEPDPLPAGSGIDINLRIEALRRNRSLNNNTASGKWLRIEKVAADYRNLLGIEASNNSFDYYDTGLLLAYAFPERIACARPGNNAQFQLANGKYAVAGHKDDLANEAWLAVANIDLRDGLGKIFLAAPLNPKDLAPLVKVKQQIKWDQRNGELITAENRCLGSIVLQSKPLKQPNQILVKQTLANAIAQYGKELLHVSNEFIQLQNRVLSLKAWGSLPDCPDVRDEFLFGNALEWLDFYLPAVKNASDLQAINLRMALEQYLGYALMQQINQLAPEKINVPSGSKITLIYFANGQVPVLAVRLQEVFGMADTPKINNGKTEVMLHLLSPGYKPVQITNDLKSFWHNTYFEVKKELQRRYPKHAWPDDPWTAAAVAKGGVKR